MSDRLTVNVSGAWEPGMSDITPIIKDLRIRSTLPGGLESVEFEIGDDYIDAYRWAYEHIGATIYVFDNSCNPPIAEAVILEPRISEHGVYVVGAGPFRAYCYRQVYNDASTWVSSGTTSAQIKDILTNECPAVSTNQDNIDETSTNNFPWQPYENTYPGDLIAFLASLSDSNNAEWYFWLQSAPMIGNAPAAPIPWFKAQSSITEVYQCWREDMMPGGLDLTPSLRDLVNDARVIYRDSSGAHQQTASATDADSQSRYWLRERWDYDLGPGTATLANQYRDLLLARYKDPQQCASFTLNAWLYDQWGGRWPLWKAITEFPFKFTVNDLLPDATAATYTLDNKRTFITLALEYDYDMNTLTVTPDTEDNRADLMLARHRALQ